MTKKSRRGLPLYARRLKERMSKLAIVEGDVEDCCLGALVEGIIRRRIFLDGYTIAATRYYYDKHLGGRILPSLTT